MSECPHKTISRILPPTFMRGTDPETVAYLSNIWQCDWCSQQFRPTDQDGPKTIELKEPVSK